MGAGTRFGCPARARGSWLEGPPLVREISKSQKGRTERRVASPCPSRQGMRVPLTARRSMTYSPSRRSAPLGKRKEKEQEEARHSGPSRCGALALAGCLTSRVASKTNGAPHGTPLKLSAFSRFNAPSGREALPRPRVFPPRRALASPCSRPTRLARARASAHAQALRPCATPG